jgi:glutamyl-tRNA synthetase
MVAFLFLRDDELEVSEDAAKTLNDTAGEVLDAALAVLEGLEAWTIDALEAALRAALVDGRGISPRHAFGPLRVGISGRRVSPPLFESMEVLGRSSSMARLRELRASL